MNNPPIGSYIDIKRSRDGFQIQQCSIIRADGRRPIERTRADNLAVVQKKAV